MEIRFCLNPEGAVVCICVFSFGNEAFLKGVEVTLSA